MATAAELTDKIVDLMADGKLDSFLDEISKACHARRLIVNERKARQNKRELSILGTRVRIAGNVKPKYLLGLTGEVVEQPITWTQKPGPNTLFVRLDHGIVRGRYGPVVGCPASCLEAE